MDQLKSILKEAINNLYKLDVEIVLSRPDSRFGDFASNVAMQLAGSLNKNPKELAEQISAEILTNSSIFEATVAGPGFLNIRLADNAIVDLLKSSTKIQQTLKDKVVVAEYSDPNPFKVLHAGHLYTSIVGDVVANVLQAAGANVHRVNFGGDVGLHVGKTMWAILQELGGENPDKLQSVDKESRLEWLSTRYVEGNEAYETNEEAKQLIIVLNKKVYELHTAKDHESTFGQIYWTCRTWSYEGFDKLYEQLQIQPFEKYMPESEVTPLGIEIVNKGLQDNIFEKSDGAVVFKGEEFGLHTRVFMNSNGLPTYEAKDLGLAATKWQDYKFDQSFIITANDIEQYMKVVMKVLSNFYPEATERTTHLTHGVIKLPGGVKMSSRKGNILRAVDILEAASSANQEQSGKDDKSVVLGAVKYAFLKQRIGSDIIYDPAESVSVAGNSGPYLQYAYARASSILQKATQKAESPTDFTDHERTLALKVSEFPEVISVVLYELMPHHICTYLYELTQVFNRFYENEKVIGSDREAQKVGLLKTYAEVLKTGLELLGIQAPESM
ncbi:MAG: arginine--tRNA ligase [bacterium]